LKRSTLRDWPDPTLRHFRHGCAFFHSKEEEYRMLLPFVKEGFDQGDKAFHIKGSGSR
jgi:hypothetical protein